MLFWHTSMCHLVRYLNSCMTLGSAQRMCIIVCSSTLAVSFIRRLHEISMLVTSSLISTSATPSTSSRVVHAPCETREIVNRCAGKTAMHAHEKPEALLR